MKQMKKGLVFGLVLMLLLTALAGCGNNNSENSSTGTGNTPATTDNAPADKPAKSDKPEKVRVSIWDR